MPKKSLVKGRVSASTQEHLDIAEIKDNTVVMKDGTLRAVLLVSSINFALKSEEEQDAVIFSYISFLNSIDFPLQIVIQSRELDMDNYVMYLKEKEKEQTNKLLRLQTSEYIHYIQELTSLGKIMSKRFYVVVPYNALSDKKKSFFSLIKEAFKPVAVLKLKEKTFARYKVSLERRMSSVESGLTPLGVGIARLDTQGLIELYYKSYNPITSQNQQLVDLEKIRVEK